MVVPKMRKATSEQLTPEIDWKMELRRPLVEKSGEDRAARFWALLYRVHSKTMTVTSKPLRV